MRHLAPFVYVPLRYVVSSLREMESDIAGNDISHEVCSIAIVVNLSWSWEVVLSSSWFPSPVSTMFVRLSIVEDLPRLVLD